MTIQEAIPYLWELAGEPSDHDIYGSDGVTLDQTSNGYRYYLRELSKAQNMLANWRTRRGRPIRFKKFFTRRTIKLGLADADLTSNGVTIMSDLYTLVITDPPTINTDYYVNTKINLTITDIDGNTYEQALLVVFVENIGGVLYFTVQDEIENASIAVSVSADFYFTAFKIVRDSGVGTGFTFNLPTYSRNIMSIIDMENGTKLERPERNAILYDYNMAEANPVQWYTQGETIYFDSYLPKQKWFIVNYQRLPLTLTTSSTELDIPHEWEDVVYMIVEMSEAKRMQNITKAAILKGQINELIDQLRTDYEEDWLGEEPSGFKIQRREN